MIYQSFHRYSATSAAAEIGDPKVCSLCSRVVPSSANAFVLQPVASANAATAIIASFFMSSHLLSGVENPVAGGFTVATARLLVRVADISVCHCH
jgi:hypothetical protein